MMDDEIETLKDEEKEKLSFLDSEYPTAHHHQLTKENHHWVGGAILIAVGTIFLLTTVLGFPLHNWWALFILVPGLFKLIGAAQRYGRDGRFSHHTRGEFTWGLILIILGCTFLFGLSWGLVWPLVLIILGAGALLSGLLGQ